MVWCRKLRAKLQALVKLEWRDILLLIEAWLMLAWVDLVISLVPYKYWRGWLLAPQLVQQQSIAYNPNAVDHIIHVAESAARNHLRPMNCLRRTLAQQKLLRRRDVQGSLSIGVRKVGEVLEAHAWLCWQGRVLNDAPDVAKRYAELQLDQWQTIHRFVD